MAKSIELEPSISWKTIPASDLSGLDALRSVDSLSINHGFSFRHRMQWVSQTQNHTGYFTGGN